MNRIREDKLLDSIEILQGLLAEYKEGENELDLYSCFSRHNCTNATYWHYAKLGFNIVKVTDHTQFITVDMVRKGIKLCLFYNYTEGAKAHLLKNFSDIQEILECNQEENKKCALT